MLGSGLVRSEVTSVPNFVQIQTSWRELGNLRTGSRPDFQVKDLSADQAAHRAFVHGQEATADPIPSFVIVASIDADHHFHLGLSPEAGIVRPPEAAAHTAVRVLDPAGNNYWRAVRSGLFLRPSFYLPSETPSTCRRR